VPWPFVQAPQPYTCPHCKADQTCYEERNRLGIKILACPACRKVVKRFSGKPKKP
jgi:ribosomal protein L37AE/L43A